MDVISALLWTDTVDNDTDRKWELHLSYATPAEAEIAGNRLENGLTLQDARDRLGTLCPLLCIFRFSAETLEGCRSPGCCAR